MVKPDAAVVYANGKKQAVAVNEYFQTGDIWFQLLAVTPKTMKIAVVDGSFTGGKHAITIKRGIADHAGEHRDRRSSTGCASPRLPRASPRPPSAKPTAAATTATQPPTGDTAAATESHVGACDRHHDHHPHERELR